MEIAHERREQMRSIWNSNYAGNVLKDMRDQIILHETVTCFCILKDCFHDVLCYYRSIFPSIGKLSGTNDNTNHQQGANKQTMLYNMVK